MFFIYYYIILYYTINIMDFFIITLLFMLFIFYLTKFSSYILNHLKCIFCKADLKINLNAMNKYWTNI